METANAARTLTEVEYLGLRGSCSLADGHAYHNLPPHLDVIVDRLPSIWRECTTRKVPDIEAEFAHIFGHAAGSKYLASATNIRIAPTASNSIDLVGALLKSQGARVALIEPTFDNLALLLRRRGVLLKSMDDQALYEALVADQAVPFLKKLDVDAIFVVNPNNPTGKEMDGSLLKRLAVACAELKLTLLLDNTFRFYRRRFYDDYQILAESDVTFICIEDTGKTWPTLDMKASILCYSDDVAIEMALLYDEVYLCSSPFSLAALGAFIEETSRVGFKDSVWKLIDERRAAIRSLLPGLPLRVDDQAINSGLSVEWLRCDEGFSDMDIVLRLEKADVTVLPGRHFYWNSSHKDYARRNVRLSFLKTQSVFDLAIQRLRSLREKGAVKEELTVND